VDSVPLTTEDRKNHARGGGCFLEQLAKPARPLVRLSRTKGNRLLCVLRQEPVKDAPSPTRDSHWCTKEGRSPPPPALAPQLSSERCSALSRRSVRAAPSRVRHSRPGRGLFLPEPPAGAPRKARGRRTGRTNPKKLKHTVARHVWGKRAGAPCTLCPLPVAPATPEPASVGARTQTTGRLPRNSSELKRSVPSTFSTLDFYFSPNFSPRAQ